MYLNLCLGIRCHLADLICTYTHSLLIFSRHVSVTDMYRDRRQDVAQEMEGN